MRSRVAMVGCKEMPEGPWILAKGNEVGLKIVHLMEGERIGLELRYSGRCESHIFKDPGQFPFPSNGQTLEKYQINKHVDEGVDPSPTRVEVLLT